MRSFRPRSFVLSVSGAIAAVSAFVWLSDEAPFPFALALLLLTPMFAVIALAVAVEASKSLIGFIARLGLALVAGLLGLLPLAMVATYLDWPYLNGWALGYGTFVVVTPLLTVVAYVALGLVPGLRDPHELL